MANKDDMISSEELGKIVKQTEKLIESEKKLSEVQKDRLKLQVQLLEKGKEELQSLEKRLETEQKEVEQIKEHLQALEGVKDASDAEVQIELTILKNKEEQLIKTKALLLLKQQEIVENKEISKALKEHFTQVNNIADTILSKLSLKREAFKNSFFGRMFDARDKGISITDQLVDIGKELISVAKPLNAFANLTTIMGKETLKLAQQENVAIASFTKATGVVGVYDDAITGLSRSNRNLGFQAADIAKDRKSVV